MLKIGELQKKHNSHDPLNFICKFEIRAKGKKDSLSFLIKALKTKYNYDMNDEGVFTDYPNHEHFSGIGCFDYNIVKRDNKSYFLSGSGACAWSVYDAMLEEESEMDSHDLTVFYDPDFEKDFDFKSSVSKKDQRPKRFVTIDYIVSAYPDLQIEIISTEPGMAFSEYYLFEDGQLVEGRKEAYRAACLEQQFGIDMLAESYPEDKVIQDLYKKFEEEGFSAIEEYENKNIFNLLALIG